MTAALNQFWAEGFKGTSVDALVDCTGLNKHSLYQAFGGKTGLFLQVLERYLSCYAKGYLAIFAQQHGFAALSGYFHAVTSQIEPRGCLVLNTAMELGDSDPDCLRLLTNYYSNLTDCLATAIEEGQHEGNIRAELDPGDTAVWLVRALQGLAVGSRLGSEQKTNANSILALLATPGAVAP
ncbi:TetR/AcrR family transcriptional regulator [Pseudomonas sp. NKUCC02_KPG]|uniref:TetR/AcrR family transcriptional regulator n=1 Tax=Pseudomonas sp. NKUCC02_KPG TaxID=2842124 RepID=UPI001C5BD74D|nr:TetR/AcrR family transcriptional regulator [Pseudomonas sp. NKUCC02_KPG]MBW3504546.1 TetR/AcrR family transcriptional regulator [Pseudomonas sp. NKUCC02_KPG]